MLATEALDNLYSHQQELLDLVAKAVALSDRNPHHIPESLAEARCRVGRAIRGYQLFKHVEIYDPLIARGDTEQRSAALVLKNACIAAGQAYCDFTRQWGAQDVIERWDEYRSSMSAMADAITAHVARERAGIQRLLARVDRTSALTS